MQSTWILLQWSCLILCESEYLKHWTAWMDLPWQWFVHQYTSSKNILLITSSISAELSQPFRYFTLLKLLFFPTDTPTNKPPQAEQVYAHHNPCSESGLVNESGFSQSDLLKTIRRRVTLFSWSTQTTQQMVHSSETRDSPKIRHGRSLSETQLFYLLKSIGSWTPRMRSWEPNWALWGCIMHNI